jgi:hypothetical protein
LSVTLSTWGGISRYMKIKTLEQARRFVIEQRICTVLAGSSKTLKSLWDAVDLPDKQPGETGWGAKVSAVWGWENQLPAHYHREIFYGKLNSLKVVSREGIEPST